MFDCGGLNIKATGAVKGMFLDKCGAACVLPAFKAVLKQDYRLILHVLLLWQKTLLEMMHLDHQILLKA